MYNEERKVSFIRSATNNKGTAKTYVSLFNKSESYEEHYNMDICQFPKEYLKDAISGGGLRAATSWWRIFSLRQYNRWCEENGYEVNKDIFEFSDIEIDTIKHKMVVNPNQLNKTLDYFLEKPEEETVDLVNRCYYWLIFGGATEQEVASMTADDIDYSTMTANGKEHEVYLYKEGMPVIKRCVELDAFKYKYPGRETAIRKRLPGTLLTRGFRGANTIRTIRTAVSAKNKEAIDKGLTNVRLSARGVYLSGVFYRKYELEISGNLVSFFDIAEEDMRNNDYVYSPKHTENMKRALLNKQYTEDYSRWKMAFNLV